MIIGISGKIGSGKDTVGKIIQYLTANEEVKEVTTLEEWLDSHDLNGRDFNYKIKKFADKLKDIVCLLIGCTREQLEDREFKEKELGEEWWKYELSWHEHAKVDGVYNTYEEACEELKNFGGSSFDEKNAITTIKLTPRLLLQLLGTECGRQIIHPNIWITSLLVDYCGDVEIWKDIKGYEGEYQISNFGRVKGLDRKIVYGDESKGEYHTKKETILKPTISGKYEMIKLKGNNSVTIHSLVANHFIPKIEGKSYINHIDQNPLNNFYKNLEWCTQSENIKSANKAGNGNIGTKQADAKLNEDKVLLIKKLLFHSKLKQKEIAEKFGVSPTTISDIKYGRKWKHVGQENIKINPILPQKLPNWIITDVRFPNELKAIKDRNGITIRVNRDQEQVLKDKGIHIPKHLLTPKHESETALDNAEFDYVIENNNTIEDLIEKVKEILIKEKVL